MRKLQVYIARYIFRRNSFYGPAVEERMLKEQNRALSLPMEEKEQEELAYNKGEMV